MKTELEKKQETLFWWIRGLDESALDELIEEYL